MHNFRLEKVQFLISQFAHFLKLCSSKWESKYIMDTKPISLWPSCLLIILIIMVNIVMLLILIVIKVLTGSVNYHHSSWWPYEPCQFLYISISPGLWSTKTRPQFLSFPTQSYQGGISYVRSVSPHAKSLVHSTLMKEAIFAPRRNLKHGVLLIGRLLKYLRGPHAFIYESPSEIFSNLPLLRDLSNLCCSAVKLPLQFLFPLLVWGKHF